LNWMYTSSDSKAGSNGYIIDEWETEYNSRMREYYYAVENETQSITFFGEQWTNDESTDKTDACGFSFDFGDYVDVVSGETQERIGGIDMAYYPDSSSETFGISVAVNVLGIIEFTESGATEGYDSDDTVVRSTSSMEMSEWKDEPTPSDTYSALTMETKKGDVGFTVYLTNSIAEVEGYEENFTINANQLKWDIYLNDYEFMEGGNRMAVKVQVRVGVSTGLIEQVDEARDESGAVTAFTASSVDADVKGYFSWVNTIICYRSDDTKSELELHSTSDADGNLYFSFDTSERCKFYVWDPSVGTAASTTATGSATSTSPAAVAQISWIAALFLSVIVMFL